MSGRRTLAIVASVTITVTAGAMAASAVGRLAEPERHVGGYSPVATVRTPSLPTAGGPVPTGAQQGEPPIAVTGTDPVTAPSAAPAPGSGGAAAPTTGRFEAGAPRTSVAPAPTTTTAPRVSEPEDPVEPDDPAEPPEIDD